MELGFAIKKCRQLRHITLDTLAARTNLSKSYLSLVENSKRELSIKNLEKVSNVLNIPIHVILYLGTEKRKINEMTPQLKDAFDKLIYELIKGE